MAPPGRDVRLKGVTDESGSEPGATNAHSLTRLATEGGLWAIFPAITVGASLKIPLEPFMSTTLGVSRPSMNEASERDPFNNNSYGTIVDKPYRLTPLPLLDVNDFNERVIRGYEEGWG